MPTPVSAVLVLTLLLVPVRSQPQGPAGDPAFVSPGTRLEKIFGDGVNTEGPAVAPDGTLYFVDAPVSSTTPKAAGRIWRVDPASGKAAIYRSPSGMALGIAFDPEGRMLVAEMSYFGGRRLTRTTLETGAAEILSGLHEGRPLGGLNDLAIDEQGRAYVTEHDAIAPHEVLHNRTPGVYRVDPDGTIDRIIANAGLPNGIAVSPDQRTLYVGTWRMDMFGARAILAYDLSPEGKAVFRSVLVRFEPPRGPDGMSVDEEGNLWVAVHGPVGQTGVAAYTADGRERAFIPTPEPAKNLAFGRGREGRTLYITAGQSVYRTTVEKRGYHLPAR